MTDRRFISTPQRKKLSSFRRPSSRASLISLDSAASPSSDQHVGRIASFIDSIKGKARSALKNEEEIRERNEFELSCERKKIKEIENLESSDPISSFEKLGSLFSRFKSLKRQHESTEEETPLGKRSKFESTGSLERFLGDNQSTSTPQSEMSAVGSSFVDSPSMTARESAQAFAQQISDSIADEERNLEADRSKSADVQRPDITTAGTTDVPIYREPEATAAAAAPPVGAAEGTATTAAASSLFRSAQDDLDAELKSASPFEYGQVDAGSMASEEASQQAQFFNNDDDIDIEIEGSGSDQQYEALDYESEYSDERDGNTGYANEFAEKYNEDEDDEDEGHADDDVVEILEDSSEEQSSYESENGDGEDYEEQRSGETNDELFQTTQNVLQHQEDDESMNYRFDPAFLEHNQLSEPHISHNSQHDGLHNLQNTQDTQNVEELLDYEVEQQMLDDDEFVSQLSQHSQDFSFGEGAGSIQDSYMIKSTDIPNTMDAEVNVSTEVTDSLPAIVSGGTSIEAGNAGQNIVEGLLNKATKIELQNDFKFEEPSKFDNIVVESSSFYDFEEEPEKIYGSDDETLLYLVFHPRLRSIQTSWRIAEEVEVADFSDQLQYEVDLPTSDDEESDLETALIVEESDSVQHFPGPVVRDPFGIHASFSFIDTLPQSNRAIDASFSFGDSLVQMENDFLKQDQTTHEPNNIDDDEIVEGEIINEPETTRQYHTTNEDDVQSDTTENNIKAHLEHQFSILKQQAEEFTRYWDVRKEQLVQEALEREKEELRKEQEEQEALERAEQARKQKAVENFREQEEEKIERAEKVRELKDQQSAADEYGEDLWIKDYLRGEKDKIRESVCEILISAAEDDSDMAMDVDRSSGNVTSQSTALQRLTQLYLDKILEERKGGFNHIDRDTVTGLIESMVHTIFEEESAIFAARKKSGKQENDKREVKPDTEVAAESGGSDLLVPPVSEFGANRKSLSSESSYGFLPDNESAAAGSLVVEPRGDESVDNFSSRTVAHSDIGDDETFLSARSVIEESMEESDADKSRSFHKDHQPQLEDAEEEDAPKELETLLHENGLGSNKGNSHTPNNALEDDDVLAPVEPESDLILPSRFSSKQPHQHLLSLSDAAPFNEKENSNIPNGPGPTLKDENLQGEGEMDIDHDSKGRNLVEDDPFVDDNSESVKPSIPDDPFMDAPQKIRKRPRMIKNNFSRAAPLDEDEPSAPSKKSKGSRKAAAARTPVVRRSSRIKQHEHEQVKEDDDERKNVKLDDGKENAESASDSPIANKTRSKSSRESKAATSSKTGSKKGKSKGKKA